MAEAVVFDMDGVLVESEHLWEELWAAFAARRGARWGPEQTKSCQGMSAPEWAAFLTGFAGGGDSAEDTERAVVDGMIAALEQGRIELMQGAEDMVASAAALGPIALASSAPRRVIDAVLERHGVDHHFKATVSSAEVARGKPSPDVYLAAAEKLGVPASDCLAVEDSSNGLRAAAAAGMTVVAIPNPQYAPAEDALAKASFASSEHAVVSRYLTGALSDRLKSRAPGRGSESESSGSPDSAGGERQDHEEGERA